MSAGPPTGCQRRLLASGGWTVVARLGIVLVLVAACRIRVRRRSSRSPSTTTGMDWLGLVTWRFLIGAGLAWLGRARLGDARAAPPTESSPGRHRDRSRGAVHRQLGDVLRRRWRRCPPRWPVCSSTPTRSIVAVLAHAVRDAPPGSTAMGARWRWPSSASCSPRRDRPGDAPPIEGLVLVMLSPVIYSVWIILSARLSGERRDRLGHEAAGRAGSTATRPPRRRSW